MGQTTTIAWTDATWNPVRGCSMAPGSETGGCLNCYAARMAARNLPGMRSPTTGQPFAILRDSGPRWTGRVELIESRLEEPMHWRKPRRVFVNSMSDLFHEALPLSDKERVFRVMLSAPQHYYQILTKRAAIMAKEVPIIMNRIFGPHWRMPDRIWLGVSVEDQATADARIPELLQTPAAIRFVSAEPLLSAIDLSQWLGGLDLVICGGESGPGARPFDLAWARNARDQCKAAGVPFFMKQLGSAPHSEADRISHRGDPLPRKNGFWKCLNDSKGGNPDEWPKDLRIREFPEAHPCR